MDTVTLDDVDRGLLHALALDGRVAFRDVAAVLAVSESTVARRYRRLRTTGTARVAGAVDGSRLGWTNWTLRLRCAPGAAPAVAAALADRADTAWIHLLSGGTEISCTVRTRDDRDEDALLLRTLPRTEPVTSVSAQLLLDTTVLPGGWAGLHHLAPEQVARLRPPVGDPAPAGAPVTELDDADVPLFDALARDGRLPYAELAAVTGRPESTVRRRTEALRRAGVLVLQLDVPPEPLGYRVQARLWLSAAPAALARTAAALAAHPEASFVASTTGGTNLTALVHCRDHADLHRYLTERVAALDGVHTVETAPVLRTVKRAGAVLPFRRGRRPVHP